MRVVLLSETFTKGMGYLENLLPKYFARLGVETHVVASDLPCYYRQQADSKVYNGFIEPLQPGSVEVGDGFTLHILGHKKTFGHMRMTGLREKLGWIRPDIVQTSTPIGWIALDAARFKASFGYKLFTGSHHHASVFSLATNPAPLWSAERLKCLALRTIPGRMVSQVTEKCHAITEDCADVAARFFGVPRSKLEICPLGVDTELFHPAGVAAARGTLRGAVCGQRGAGGGDPQVRGMRNPPVREGRGTRRAVPLRGHRGLAGAGVAIDAGRRRLRLAGGGQRHDDRERAAGREWREVPLEPPGRFGKGAAGSARRGQAESDGRARRAENGGTI